ncbi:MULTISPECIES: bifunctional 2-C-methyl-D-erythritol 4-phosphate cytidylyltransferase/2-C-methyl-D-erythritol 2,4-cyclodiphosphate synthase [Rhodophyticola]|jgi:2-C-methyl-D-erythritol 4-phosphate cytidylyltransferase/2-C-methyl-D-erythritol 2,4-cyclodiphosphate synthase|uniref:bifunctional 2-C-methyl-D-erythritol 4-phosphate cytidylyltransferase/2-C-methyl-D-erythritol 2,4-cyclodiphosphate synthase n=1 Tax=Rhodophyticola TaxID=2680018 RepID=UPI0035D12B88
MTVPAADPPVPTAAALIVAAGRGIRAGGEIPKQYRMLEGDAVLTRTLRAFAGHPAIGQIVVVRHPEDADLFAAARPDTRQPLVDVIGGDSRDASVRAGLAAVDDAMDYVLIHDAARPLVSPDVIDGVLAALARHDGAAPALPVTDALWRGGSMVSGTQDRSGLWRAQTPQGFRLGPIRAAHAAHPGGAADDVEVARAFGLEVAITRGCEDNLKITAPDDFARAARLVKGQQMDIRTGNGFDVHRFGPGDHVMLCGVAIPHTRGLQGHSDADVGLHTVTDAIYGALAAGDIGTHFPPSDPQWKGVASHVFLTHAVEMAGERGFAITHADLTLICEQPRIGAHAGAMRAELARILRIGADRVSVKATTSERLGFTGREEGIAALATVTLVAA